MSLRLTSQSSQFICMLPNDFVTEDIEKKYSVVLKEQHSQYDSVLDYLNACIRSVTFPGLNFEESTQTIMRGKKITYKGATNIHDQFSNQITVTLENVDANLSYIIIHEIMIKHYLDVDNIHIQPLFVAILNPNRKAIHYVRFKDMVPKSISDITFNHSTYLIDDNTFEISFLYNFFEIEYIPLPDTLLGSSPIDDAILEDGFRPSFG